LGLAGCYDYGYRRQLRQFVLGVNPAVDIIRARRSDASRERREALVRLVRFTAHLKGEDAVWYTERIQRQLRMSVSLLHQPDPVVRATASALLRQVGSAADAPMLRRGLQGDAAIGLEPEPSAFVRREIVTTLGYVGSPEDADVLVTTLKRDVDDRVRSEAARSLGRLKAMPAIPALIERVDDPDESVACACWSAVHEITGQDLAPAEYVWKQWWERQRQGG
jgi:HEAT repeat protein